MMYSMPNDLFINSLVIGIFDVNIIAGALSISFIIGSILALNCSESFLGSIADLRL